MLTQKNIIDTAERLGWTCEIRTNKKDKWNKDYFRKWSVSFQRYTDKGQDVCFDFDLHSLQELPDELYRTWEGYDPDEETALWIGADGHGKNGAPYRISDILKDMEEVDTELNKLQTEISKLE